LVENNKRADIVNNIVYNCPGSARMFPGLLLKSNGKIGGFARAQSLLGWKRGRRFVKFWWVCVSSDAQ
jgi:hypothetical protein